MGSSTSKFMRTARARACQSPQTQFSPTKHGSQPKQTAADVQGQSQLFRLFGTILMDKANLGVDFDARDTHFGDQLRSLGAVQPNPHFSTTSASSLDPRRGAASNRTLYPAAPAQVLQSTPALVSLAARQRLHEQAELEISQVGRHGFAGRTFVDVDSIRQCLMLRRRGEEDVVIEKKLGLQGGCLSSLGREIVDIP